MRAEGLEPTRSSEQPVLTRSCLPDSSTPAWATNPSLARLGSKGEVGTNTCSRRRRTERRADYRPRFSGVPNRSVVQERLGVHDEVLDQLRDRITALEDRLGGKDG